MVLFWPWTEGRAATSALDALREKLPPGAELTVLDREPGFAAAVNRAARADRDADVVIVADSGALPYGWLERLARAAHDDHTVAGASALVSPDEAGPGELLAEPVHPRVSTLDAHCAYIRRSTLELVGPLEESIAHPAAVLDELAARALGRGLTCALADDVWVSELPGGLPPCPAGEAARVTALHPWIAAVREAEEAVEVGPLRRSLVAARVARRRAAGAPLSVTIDARALGPTAAGTQTYVGGVTLALARSGRVAVRAVVRDDSAVQALDELDAAGVELVTETAAADGLARSDVAHRPQQAFVPEDLSLLRKLGERVVISHLDLISYRNPTYHESAGEWWRYRRLTRLALGSCDRVVFLSDHARHDAISEDLIEPGYTSVCGVGVDPTPAHAPAVAPDRVPPGRELLVMIGADYAHKNRLFALELLDELRGRHGWAGTLVLAGAHVPHGGSAEAESEWLRARRELAADVVDLGPVGEPEKRWLLGNAAAVLCPSTYEGFGLAPLEAAAFRTPCLYAPITSLAEVAGREAATLAPWNAAASAEAALPLLFEGDPRERHLAALRGALDRYTWDSVVERLLRVYEDAVTSPYRSSVPRAWEELEREQLIALLDRAYHELHDRVEHGLPLIDEHGGALSHEQQRGLMRIAARGWLRGPLLGSIGLLGGMRPDDQGPSSS
jgi:glycosyltransferase involved in cell wall biosynthesis